MVSRAYVQGFVLAALVLGIGRAEILSAATLTWNANGTGVPADGGGIWGTNQH